MREIVLDTETTGLDPLTGDRVVEVGCVELYNHIPTGQTFHCYVNPERDMPTSAFEVHGLSAESLKDMPPFAEIAEEFLAFVGNDVLVIHNAAFDAAFLNSELERLGKPLIARERLVDTLLLARRLCPGESNRLDDLCARYGIDNSGHNRRSALFEAEILAEVYIELIAASQATPGLEAIAAARKKHGRQREERRKRAEAKREREEKEAKELRFRVVRVELAEAASPAPSLARDGRLDAGPNAAYDVPTADSDLPALPIRQRALIKIIRSDLPRNAPKHLKVTLDNYDDELKARGVQPLLGLLKDMAAIIEATVGAPDAAREWLPEGLLAAFDRFAQNHALFVKHFPLDPKREELYARTFVDESNATETLLSDPFQEVATATSEANQAGLATDDFLKIVVKMAEFAKIIATLPPPPVAPLSPSRGDNARGETAVPFPTVSPEDRVVFTDAPISPKKRMLLSGFGFFERAYNLLGSTASLISLPAGNALLRALRDAIATLSKLISP